MKRLICFSLVLFIASLAFCQTPAPRPPVPGGTPDYFGMYPNYATSALPLRSCSVPAPQSPLTTCYGDLDCAAYVDSTTGAVATCSGPIISGGIRKFMDALPNLPIAVPDTTTYPGSDYYEIELREYQTQFHTDLSPTTVRGYVQTNMGTHPISYLGPVIVATRDRPVRVKFTNALPTGAGGDLFIPVDTTYMGAGEGPVAGQNYKQNRATLHLHGGTTPWISDGTPHQWTTPAGETTAYPKGVSVQNVPDMPPAADGSLTFFYSNQQSARLMFYHDHAYGITRLNVYVGEAAGYLLTDNVEQGLISSGILPGVGTPLVIQDKTFVWGAPPVVDTTTNTVTTPGTGTWAADPTWNWGKDGAGNFLIGGLWFPHVYMPNQNPYDLSGANMMGRWDYGPWFWPPFTGLTFGPIANPYFDPACVSSSTTYCEPPEIPGTPESRGVAPSGVPESFMDTPVVNGKAYPTMQVPAGPVRLRILNAANDRYWNLSLWLADPSVVTQDGRSNTEVKMVPFNSSAGVSFPTWWGVLDGRDGGVPDPGTRGPAMIQIGTEGGFLPAPVVIRNQPINYNYNRRDITVLNVLEKALFLGPAERADVIVDFTPFAGKTLILYNDAPAPVPAADPRIDYYTGDLDQTDTGGAPTTQPGYGPNTRTILQIQVGGSGGAGGVDYVNSSMLTALQTALPTAFANSQDTIIVPQAPYNGVYNPATPFKSDASVYVKIQDTSFTFTPIGSTLPVTADLAPKSIIEDFQMDYGRMNALIGVEVPRTTATTQTSIPQGYIDPPTEVMKVSDGKFLATSLGTLSDGTQIWKVTHNGVDTHAIHWHMFNVQLINRVGWDGAIKPPDANELGWKETVRMNPLEDVIVALRPITINVPFEVPNSVRLLDVTKPQGSMMGFTNVAPDGNPVNPGIMNDYTNFGWEYVWHCHLLGHEENDMMRGMAVAVPPKAPVVTATADPSGTPITLNWTEASVNQTSFTVQRATDQTFQTGLQSFPVADPKQTSYVDNTAVSGTGYYYRVLASDTVGSMVPGYPTVTADSPWSNVAVIQPTPVASVSPTSLTFQPQIQGTTSAAQNVTLSNNGSADLLNIVVTSSSANFVANSACGTTLAAGTSCTIAVTFAPQTAGALTGTLTIASNDPINPTLSVSLSGTGLVPPPVVPTNLQASAVGSFQVNLSWSWTQGAGGLASGFTVQRATGATGGAFATIATVNSATTMTYSDTTVLDGTTYRYQVLAFNNTGASQPSNTASATTPLAPPSNLTAAVSPANPPGGVMLTWTNVSKTATGITIQRAGNSAMTSGLKSWTLTGQPTSFVDNSAVAGATYYYQIRATNGAIVSLWVPAAGLPFTPTIPAAPSGLAVGSVTRTTVTLTWTDNATNEGGFTVQRATNANFTQGLQSFNVAPSAGSGATVTFTVTGLTRNQKYYFRVRAYNGVGTSAWVNGTSAVTLP